ncbi:MAG TPA: hypothetical protein VJG90_05095 [Candidatus Nanoarchaeia archaeon]|nr:hypothetical protein [Candidatus Nanoarchaeia archaeon]
MPKPITSKVFLGTLIIIFAFIAISSENESSSCVEEVNSMRHNQTELLLKGQEPLNKWAGSWSLRELYKIQGEKDNMMAVIEGTNKDASEWITIVSTVETLNRDIESKEKECRDRFSRTQFVHLLILVLSLLSLSLEKDKQSSP